MGIRKQRVLPNRLRMVRAEQRMTQFVLAQKSRVHTSRISHIENELVEPTQNERDRIARALKTDVAIVFPVPVVAAPDAEAVAS